MRCCQAFEFRSDIFELNVMSVPEFIDNRFVFLVSKLFDSELCLDTFVKQRKKSRSGTKSSHRQANSLRPPSEPPSSHENLGVFSFSKHSVHKSKLSGKQTDLSACPTTFVSTFRYSH